MYQRMTLKDALLHCPSREMETGTKGLSVVTLTFFTSVLCLLGYGTDFCILENVTGEESDSLAETLLEGSPVGVRQGSGNEWVSR